MTPGSVVVVFAAMLLAMVAVVIPAGWLAARLIRRAADQRTARAQALEIQRLHNRLIKLDISFEALLEIEELERIYEAS